MKKIKRIERMEVKEFRFEKRFYTVRESNNLCDEVTKGSISAMIHELPVGYYNFCVSLRAEEILDEED